MHTKTINEIRQLLAAKKISSVELTKHFLGRITKFNSNLNAFISVTAEEALASAKVADDKISKGEQQSLTGIPIAHKDIFCTKDIKTTCGSKMLDNFIAPYNATVVEKLNNAGTVMLGKLNMDEFAMGSSNENSFYGAVKNPWNLECVPGGSSGGSAAAVAAGLAFGVTGTDTGGSIRQPAAFCGITGIKPTYGLISRFGMIAFASSLDQAGPMAKTAEDCALLLQEMAGFDVKDSTSLEQQVPNFSKTLNDDIKGLRIGLPKEFFSKDLDPAMAEQVNNCVKELEKLGATVKEISLPNTHLSIPAYYIIAPAEASSNLARYDGVRFGYRCDNPKDLQDLYKRTRTEGFGLEVKRRILVGTFVLSAGFYDAYYIKAQKIRRLIASDFAEAFKEVDVIMGPTTPTPAFKINSKKDPVSMYLNDMYTSSTNLAGLPGISFPCGVVNGLPVGAHIIGNYMSEAKLLNIAHKFQQVSNWHQQTPTEFK